MLLVMAILWTMTILLLLVTTRLPIVCGDSVMVCFHSKSWILSSLSERQKVFRCSEYPFKATMEINTTIGPIDLPVASLIYQWGYRYLHEHSSADPMFQKMDTAPKTDRLGIDSSLAAQNLDGFDEDRFLHHSTIDKVFNDMLGKGYHVTSELKQMVFAFPYVNGTMVMANGEHILSKKIHF